jgi:mRNA-degrading endonuclease HigB of HigAB toxin-antitoxin module
MIPIWDHGEVMRFVGQAEIAAFLAEYPDHSDGLRAWLAEMKHRTWSCADALAADFLNVDTANLPVVIFYLEPTALRIETLVDFRNRVVLLTAIQRLTMTSGNLRQTGTMHRDH